MAKKDKKDPKLKTTAKKTTKKVAKKVVKKKVASKKTANAKKTSKKVVKVKKKAARKKAKADADSSDELSALAAEPVVEAGSEVNEPKASRTEKPESASKGKRNPGRRETEADRLGEAGDEGGGASSVDMGDPQTEGADDSPTVGGAGSPSERTADEATTAGRAGSERGSRRRSSRGRGARRRDSTPTDGDAGDAAKPSDQSKATAEAKEAARQADEADNGPEPEPEPEPDPGPPPPERVDLAEFQQRKVAELYELGTSLNLRVGGITSKHDLIFEILTHWGLKGTKIDAEGVLEITNDGYGFLRWPAFNFTPHADDVYISPNFIRDHNLQNGNLVRVVARAPREREKFISVDEVTHVENLPVDQWVRPPAFDKLTALSPRERLVLEDPERRTVSPRAIDIIAPLGKGQRGVIVAPPRGGKTILLKEIAGAISRNHPETEVIVLLLDERPEEVTDFEESEVANVFSSTFDEPPERHVQVAELVAERAKRLVEIGKDVVILMDSLTRLARGYNGLTKGKGKTMSGGIDAGALQKARRLFNIARNTEEGGSLTLIATALIDTGARMDDVIFEEFKGSGNMEVELDRELLERRIFPAINIQKSGTRKDDLLYHPDEFKRIGMIRRQLAQLPGGEAMEKLIHNIENTKSNAELLLAGLK